MKKKKSQQKKVKRVKKITHKKPASIRRQEVVVKVQTLPVPFTPTALEPIKENSKYFIPATWVSEKQVLRLVQKTPPQYILRRKGKGGQTFDYVTGNYIQKVLNFTFGWLWDFEVINQGREGNLVWVLGKLTAKSQKGDTITKTQFGRADIKFYKDKPTQAVDFGNDLKAAATDALKKCASQLGIAADVYGKSEYKEEAGVEIPDTPAPVKKDSPQIYAECQNCGNPMSKEEVEYSKKMFKKQLCRSCQVELRKK